MTIVEEQPAPTRSATIAHLPGLDGLRGVAVVAVVAYHLGWVSGGFLGVDVFFVLSGFLVTSVVLAEVAHTGRVGLRAFWGRRVRRLVPAVLVLVPTVLVAALLVDWPATRRGELATDGFATLTWWANWRQTAGDSYWAPGPSPFRHAWSLAIEEQFYLAWPLVVLAVVALARRRGWSVRPVLGTVAAVGAAASALWLVVLSRSLDAAELSRAYVGTDTRVAAPLVGCALACWWSGRDHDPAAPAWRGQPALVVAGHGALAVLVLLVATVHVPDPGLYRNGGFALAAVAAAVVVAALAVGTGRPGRQLGVLGLASLPPLRHLGTRSYGIYLWSWPIQALLQHWRPEWSRLRVTLLVVVATAVAAELSYALVEDPLRRRRSWARRPALRRPAWAIGAAVALLAVVVVHERSAPAPAFEQLETAESAELNSAPPLPAESPRDGIRVMVEGDSVAFTAVFNGPTGDELPPGIDAIDGRGLLGCGVLAALDWSYQLKPGQGWFHPGAGDCPDQPAIEALGLAGRPDVVLLFTGAWEFLPARSPDGDEPVPQSEEMADVLVDAILIRARAAHEAGASFVLPQWSCPGRLTVPERRDPAYIEWLAGVLDRAAAEAVAEGIDAWVLPPNDQICVGGDPTAEPTDEWRAAIGDEIHVRSHEGGLRLWDTWLGPALTARPPG